MDVSVYSQFATSFPWDSMIAIQSHLTDETNNFLDMSKEFNLTKAP